MIPPALYNPSIRRPISEPGPCWTPEPLGDGGPGSARADGPVTTWSSLIRVRDAGLWSRPHAGSCRGSERPTWRPQLTRAAIQRPSGGSESSDMWIRSGLCIGAAPAPVTGTSWYQSRPKAATRISSCLLSPNAQICPAKVLASEPGPPNTESSNRFSWFLVRLRPTEDVGGTRDRTQPPTFIIIIIIVILPLNS